MTGRVFQTITALLVFAAFPFSMRAAEVSASASLSRNVTTAGQPVTLSITVSGARGAEVQGDLQIDGLDIRYAGQSTQIQMRNFQVTSSVSHNYQITPLKPGKYTIPAQRVRAGNDTFQTNPVTLTVTPAVPGTRGTVRGPAQGTGEIDLSDIAFAELVVPKSTAFVGQSIPIEIRFYFDANVNFRADTNPSLTGEGFTSGKLSDPRQDRIERDGRVFDLVTYQTVITPVKAGELKLGPAELQCTASIPRARQNLRHLGVDDFFNDDFFNNPFSAFAQTREVLVRSGLETVQVKPLPREGQPKDFSGAIGNFTMESGASPQTVNIGEPVTLNVTIKGTGNFDRIGDPELGEARGWRSYPPSNEFAPSDTLGLSGSRTYKFALVPNRKEQELPRAEFTYFDPEAAKYVTLKSEPIAVEVTGSAPATTPAPTVGSTTANAEAEATPAEETAPRDIHFILTGPADWDESFEPLYQRTGFWLAQLVPFAALLGFMGVQVYRRRANDTAARELASLRSQRAACERALHRSDSSPQEFIENAVRLVQLDTAARSGISAATVDAESAITSRNLDPDTARAIREVFEARDELVYAGFGGGFDTQRRAAIMDALKRFLA